MKTTLTILLLILFGIASASLSTTFTNPIIPNENNPDPGAIYHLGNYYVVNTASGIPSKFPIHQSSDLQNWTLVGYIFPAGQTPSWTNPNGAFWAPEIHIVNNKFNVYFAATDQASNIICVGVATSDSILGPYVNSTAPLIKNITMSSIDPTVMSVENDTKYLVWKTNGAVNDTEFPTWIWAQELTSDGMNVTGPLTQLIEETLPWEGNLVEAPWIIKKGGWYYLFYSGNFFCYSNYSIGVARSQNPLGPYEKKGDPILVGNSVWAGPGHCSVIRDRNAVLGQYVIIYHAWEATGVCGNNNRYLMIDFVHWNLEGWPYIANSSSKSTVFEPLELNQAIWTD